MKRKVQIKKILLHISLLLLINAVNITYCLAQDTAKIVHVNGKVWVIPANQDYQQVVKAGQRIQSGDLVITGSNGTASLLLVDETLLRLHNSSEFQLNTAAPVAGWLTNTKSKLKSSYKLIKGELWFRNKRREAEIEITTAHVSISVRGTEFSVQVKGDASYVNMLEGQVSASNEHGSVEAATGEQIIAEEGKVPYKRILLSPDDAVQWAIRLPELFSTEQLFPYEQGLRDSEDTTQPIDPSSTNYNQALDQIRSRNYKEALETLSLLSEEIVNYPRATLLKAWILLQTGKVKESKDLLSLFIEKNPKSHRGLQLLALTSLISGDNQFALENINQAISLDKDIPESHLLKSYISQSLFKLTNAKLAAKTSVSLGHQFVLGWLQLARLSVANGNYEAALSYADQAKSIAPDNDEVWSSLGFIQLAMGNIHRANNLFDKALSFNQALADAHLGKALAGIRKGATLSTLEHMATAVAIAPLESTYFTYYGKLLYHNGRRERAVEVLERAAELDPNDPAPLYLLAIINRDLNRDASSIELLQKAQSLNDKRAVYRSRQLLDSDLATRNTDLSLAFTNFNFDAWAQRRATDAILLDPTNYSSRLMLASSLNDQPGRDTAFASAAMQARLLQPATANTFNSPNDYTTLFETPDFGGTLTARSGSFDQEDYELILYGAHPESRTAFQLAALNNRTDGWRGTQNETLEDYAAILKWDPTYKSGLTLSIIDQNFKQFDSFLGRFEFDVNANARNFRKIDLFNSELGYRYQLDPNNLILGQIGYLKQKSITGEFTQQVIPFPVAFGGPIIFDEIITGEKEESYWQAQLQYTFHNPQYEFSFGTINYFGDTSLKTLNKFELLSGPAVLPPTDGLDADSRTHTQYHSGFMLAKWGGNERFTFDAGLHLEYFQNSNPEFDQNWDQFKVNPRLGMTINITSQDTIRIGGYRYIFSLLPGRIDPVEVAGLTIYRGNNPGTQVEEVNLGYEREWSTGFIQVIGFYGEDKSEFRLPFATTIISGGSQLVSVEGVAGFTNARRSGTDLALNQLIYNQPGLLFDQLGVALNFNRLRLEAHDVSPAFNTDTLSLLNREDEVAELVFKFISKHGIEFEIGEVYRHVRFDSARTDEEFHSLNAALSIELPNKFGTIRLEANNINDEPFNWVTDNFVLDGYVPRRQTMLSLEINI